MMWRDETVGMAEEVLKCDDPECTEHDAETRERLAQIECPGEVHGWWCSAFHHETENTR